MKQLAASLFCAVLGFAMGLLLLGQLPTRLPNEPEAQEETEAEICVQTAEPIASEALPVMAPIRRSFDESFHLPVLVDGELVSMSLRNCVLGAVLGEMPAEFHPEALKAQAVACRTYAMRQYLHRKHENAALCTDPGCCMNWVDPEDYIEANGVEAFEKVAAAVEATDGEAVCFQDELIAATFFSCSGGRTESASDVWGGELPYLQAVDSPGEEAPWDTDTLCVPIGEFTSVLSDANEMALFPENGEWFGPVTHTAGGGVDTMELGGCIYTGVQLRKLFHLRSTLFTVEREGEQIVFTTHGFGHRVGLSQYGAEKLASDGCDYRQILQWYYPGTELRENSMDV